MKITLSCSGSRNLSYPSFSKFSYTTGMYFLSNSLYAVLIAYYFLTALRCSSRALSHSGGSWENTSQCSVFSIDETYMNFWVIFAFYLVNKPKFKRLSFFKPSLLFDISLLTPQYICPIGSSHSLVGLPGFKLCKSKKFGTKIAMAQSLSITKSIC